MRFSRAHIFARRHTRSRSPSRRVKQLYYESLHICRMTKAARLCFSSSARSFHPPTVFRHRMFHRGARLDASLCLGVVRRDALEGDL